MKKILFYFLILIAICFLLPIFFVDKNSKEVVSNEEEILKEKYNYKEYSIVKLFHTKTGETEELPLDTYLYGVVSSEMPADFSEEALKAQAVVARTYTVYKIINNNGKHKNADICDSSTCCQAWISKEDRQSRWDENLRESNWDKIVDCVEKTKGKIITYDGKPINAFFHSNSGGITEIPLNVWGGSGYPYLKSVQISGEDTYSQYLSEVKITKDEFIKKIKEKYKSLKVDWNVEKPIEVTEYTESGRVKTFKVGNTNLSGVEARTIIGLKSANFDFKIDRKLYCIFSKRIWTWCGNESDRSR